MPERIDEARAVSASERLLEDSWKTRSREVTSRELIAEAIAGALFLAVAGALALLAGGGIDARLAALLVVLYAIVSRIEFPIGVGFFVPSYLVLVPMLVLLPPADVPLLTALALVLAAAVQWMVGRAAPERLLFSIPDAWHAVGPALVLVLFGEGQSGVGLAAIYVAAFLSASLFDLFSATAREAAALGVAPQVQIRVHAHVWLVDACLAPIGLLAAEAASHGPQGRVLLILPLGALLFILARDRTARIVQSQRRREQAFTDPLTGLGNRRLLARDLREQIENASEAEPVALVVLDLNGFKTYNDTFGHAAGDALLARLGEKLAAAVGPDGAAYRLGGDEFCVLVEATEDRADIATVAAEALTERGEEFAVSAAHGTVLVPQEVDDPDQALQLADLRMYEKKNGRAAGAREDAHRLLMRSMNAQSPTLHEHSRGVAELAARVGRRFGMDAEQIDVTMRAAELHDLGKVGIPDVILDKPGALNPTQWELMRQHTILGERILNASPAMRPVARIVRATHERWDGRGYPDGLAKEQIPLGARIVAVCDAYSAMIDKRPYASARSHDDACRELRREAGRQFDAQVVEVFLAEVASEPEPDELRRPTEVGASELDDMTAHLRELMNVRRAAMRNGDAITH